MTMNIPAATEANLTESKNSVTRDLALLEKRMADAEIRLSQAIGFGQYAMLIDVHDLSAASKTVLATHFRDSGYKVTPIELLHDEPFMRVSWSDKCLQAENQRGLPPGPPYSD